MTAGLHIGGRAVGTGLDPYIIAEIGVNHDGDVERALQLVDLAEGLGADAIKVQYFRAELLMSGAARLAGYQQAAGETDAAAMLRRLELDLLAMERVVERAHARGLHAIVTVFSLDLVEDAKRLAWDAFKTASPDIIHRPLLEAIAGDGRPLIVSTGASTMEEVMRACEWLGGARGRLALLQCVSSYPAPQESLEGIPALAAATDLPVGYSDHTASVGTGARAVQAGACVLERHITDDRGRVGPDHAASLNGAGFAEYVRLARAARNLTRPAAGPAPGKKVLDCERDVRLVSRQSIVTRRAMAAGQTITSEDLTFKRPGSGIEPFRLGEVVGRRLACAVEADVPLTGNDLA
ncbi:MAG: N-acetylneuraminate synthase family protein [Phycisphaerales bacterium]|nr:N-acetylneuraminate synthase family protein [Phycisphaerales bacterium]